MWKNCLGCSGLSKSRYLFSPKNCQRTHPSGTQFTVELQDQYPDILFKVSKRGRCSSMWELSPSLTLLGAIFTPYFGRLRRMNQGWSTSWLPTRWLLSCPEKRSHSQKPYQKRPRDPLTTRSACRPFSQRPLHSQLIRNSMSANKSSRIWSPWHTISESVSCDNAHISTWY